MSDELIVQKKRRAVSCSLCHEEGHNIRGCKLFSISQKEGIDEYLSFLHHCIVGYANQWVFPSRSTNESELDFQLIPPNADLLRLFQDNIAEGEDGMLSVLQQPIKWLTDLSAMKLNALIRGYHICSDAPREHITILLHYLFIREADGRLVKNFINIETNVPYLIHSRTHIKHLEYTAAMIFNYPIFQADSGIIVAIHTTQQRHDRVRSLHNTNNRLLRYSNDDNSRVTRRIQNTHAEINRLQSDLVFFEENRISILERRKKLLRDATFFQANLMAPYISIHEQPILENQTIAAECPICYGSFFPDKMVMLNCHHVFCVRCIFITLLKSYDNGLHSVHCPCPFCRTEIRKLYGNLPVMKERLLHTQRKLRIQNDISDLIH